MGGRPLLFVGAFPWPWRRANQGACSSFGQKSMVCLLEWLDPLA